MLFSDGNLTQTRGSHSQVHYLFNTLLFNSTEQSYDSNLINTWKTLYEVSQKSNQSTYSSSLFLSKQLTPLFTVNFPNQKYVFLFSMCACLLLMMNFCLCIIFSRRGHGCRKREYNCLSNHKQLNMLNQSNVHQHHGGSSPTSTNSNGTITLDSTQQLIVNVNSHEQERQSSPLSSLLCTTTNSSINSTPPVDILHPINITKKNGILKCSTMKKSNVFVPSSLPEAIV